MNRLWIVRLAFAAFCLLIVLVSGFGVNYLTLGVVLISPFLIPRSWVEPEKGTSKEA